MPHALPLGILCAIPEELKHLEDRDDGSEVVGGLVFHRGRIEGLPAVFVETGIGKVNAATTATILVSHFHCRALLFCGVAGGLDPALGIGDVVVATRLVQHDYGALQSGGRIAVYQPGIPPFPGYDATHGYDMPGALQEKLRARLSGLALPAIATAVSGAAPRQPQVHFGTVLTGDSFVNDEAERRRLQTTFNALAVEMEGAAVAQVAQRFRLPWLVVRCLSDLAGADSHINFGAFMPLVAEAAALVLRRAVSEF